MTSMMLGNGVLLLVWRWCTCHVLLTTIGEVLSIDVVDSFSTLAIWLSRVKVVGLVFAPLSIPMMVLSFFKTFACAHLLAAVVGT